MYASLYPDLKRLARARLRQQGRGESVSTTLLVHESFVRLVGARDLRLEDRRHFFAYAAKTMRNIIIDSAREHLAERRGGGAEHVTLGDADSDAMQVADAGASDELVRVNEALRKLEAVDVELAELVEMRYFGGYSEVEIAELQGVNERTVRRRWDKARAWLFVALGQG
ncbi:MAG: sigma-70 family RNA polymerase sigma factor [Rhizobiales bacterium]|nr:sigma-70 family RNA polymerase sigma factor [Rhizobacter sp.]